MKLSTQSTPVMLNCVTYTQITSKPMMLEYCITYAQITVEGVDFVLYILSFSYCTYLFGIEFIKFLGSCTVKQYTR